MFPALASALIILAEFSRVFLLSDTSAKYLILLQSCSPSDILHRFTEDSKKVIKRLEDEKTPPKEEHDKQVMRTTS